MKSTSNNRSRHLQDPLSYQLFIHSDILQKFQTNKTLSYHVIVLKIYYDNHQVYHQRIYAIYQNNFRVSKHQSLSFQYYPCKFYYKQSPQRLHKNICFFKKVTQRIFIIYEFNLFCLPPYIFYLRCNSRIKYNKHSLYR